MIPPPAAESEQPANHPPMRLTGCTPIRVLRGGMSLVYLCRSEYYGDGAVAVKRLRPDMSLGDGADDRFLRECFLWLQIGEHPNIARAFSAHRAQAEAALLVLEYLPGSLRDRFHRARLDLRDTLRLATDLTLGLLYARAALPGFVHADLKPENVLVDDAGTAKITDLGLARSVLRSPDGRAVAEVWGGTPLYMAPEQMTGPAVAASDVYAIGCILFEALAGSPAYRMPLHSGHRPVRQPVRRLTPADAPPDLLRLVDACLADDPAARPELADLHREIAALSRAHGLEPAAPREFHAVPGAQVDAMRGLLNLGFAKDARRLYEAMPSDPDDLSRRIMYIRVLNEDGDWQRALAELAEFPAESLDSDVLRGALWSERGRAELGAGRRREALRAFAEAARVSPRASVVWQNLAASLYQDGEVADAIVALKMAILISANLAFLVNLVKWLVEIGRPHEALRYAQAAGKLHPGTLLAVGALLIAQEDVAKHETDAPYTWGIYDAASIESVDEATERFLARALALP